VINLLKLSTNTHGKNHATLAN